MLPECAELPPERGRATRVKSPLQYRDGPHRRATDPPPYEKAKAFVGERRFRQQGSLGGGLMATLLFSQRQRGQISSLGRNIVAATLLPKREFRQSGGPCGLIVAATLLRECSFRLCVSSTLFHECKLR